MIHTAYQFSTAAKRLRYTLTPGKGSELKQQSRNCASKPSSTGIPCASSSSGTACSARLEAMHAAKLLGDEDLYAVEDAIAD
jgi:hypothetical protein